MTVCAAVYPSEVAFTVKLPASLRTERSRSVFLYRLFWSVHCKKWYRSEHRYQVKGACRHLLRQPWICGSAPFTSLPSLSVTSISTKLKSLPSAVISLRSAFTVSLDPFPVVSATLRPSVSLISGSHRLLQMLLPPVFPPHKVLGMLHTGKYVRSPCCCQSILFRLYNSDNHRSVYRCVSLSHFRFLCRSDKSFTTGASL